MRYRKHAPAVSGAGSVSVSVIPAVPVRVVPTTSPVRIVSATVSVAIALGAHIAAVEVAIITVVATALLPPLPDGLHRVSHVLQKTDHNKVSNNKLAMIDY